MKDGSGGCAAVNRVRNTNGSWLTVLRTWLIAA